MKPITVLAFVLLVGCALQAQTWVDSLNKLKVGVDYKPTHYKPGFKYYDTRGMECTLLKWVNTGHSPVNYGNISKVDQYRWKVTVRAMGVSVEQWTDDEWIDVATGKAYLDEKVHKIKYYPR